MNIKRPTTGGPASEVISEQAAEWFLRMKDGPLRYDGRYANSSDAVAAFHVWLAQSPEHRRAYRQIERLHDVILGFEGLSGLKIHTPVPKNAARAGCRLPWRRFPAARVGLVAMLVVVTLTLPLLSENFLRASPQDYSTGIGERETIQLEDGSSIVLNTQSRAVVLFSAREREVRLLSGEALFTVQHDSRRPFRVLSNGALLEDVGTTFSVYSQRSGTIVSVVNGQVRLYCNCINASSGGSARGDQSLPPGTTPSVSVVLREGDQGKITRGQGPDLFYPRHLGESEVQDAIAWRNGVICFKNIPLRQAVEEFNRYNRQRILIADSAIAKRLVSGRFDSPNIDHFLSALAETYQIQVAHNESSAPGAKAGDIIELIPATATLRRQE